VSAPIVVSGAAGRMGRLVAGALLEARLGEIAGFDPAATRELALPEGSIPIFDDLAAGLAPGGVLVDFSHPGATPALVAAVRARKAKLVVGTTGQSPAELQALRQLATEFPVVLARNFSLGINRLAEVLPALRVLLSDGFDVECMEAHHRRKRDAPSGTALLLLEALLGEVPERRVHGRSGAEARRQPGEVGVHSLRLGGVAGEHALLFGSEHEVIEIRHRALDRTAFVSGVVPAVRFVQIQPAGLYSMLDVMRHAAAAET
jgi:4-hydroxy-tetrahydrodipicolinate reductase